MLQTYQRLITKSLRTRLLQCLPRNFSQTFPKTVSDYFPEESEGVDKRYVVPNAKHFKYSLPPGKKVKHFSYAMEAIPINLSIIAVQAVAGSFITSIDVSENAVLASKIEVDLTTIQYGEVETFVCSGKPTFIFHRTDEDIKMAEKHDTAVLRDPQTDKERTKNQRYLIVTAVCTHLGCTPVSRAGDYNGFYCPCHGSHYDTSGRIRKGPAPTNLAIPPYKFNSETDLVVG